MSSKIKYFKIMFAGLFSLMLTMGVARFSLTPLLPVMMDETFLNNASGGWLASINYMGYMTGVLITASISDLKLKFILYRAGLIIAILSTVGMALADNYILWSVMRFVAGLTSAAGLLMGSGLILNWMMKNGHRAELGIHFGGAGLGIALSAAVAMIIAGHFDWAQQWEIFAAVGVILAIPAWFWLPPPDASHVTHAGEKLVDKPPTKSWMTLLLAAYFCAGFGYVISATFLVSIVENQPSLQGSGSMIWLITGLAAAPACVFWDRIARKFGELNALFAAYAINIVGIVIPAFDHSFFAVSLSGVLFGATFIGIVSLMLTMVGKLFPTKPAKPMGKLTLSYGTAQIIAPAISGMMAETTGNYNMPLILAGIIMAVGMVLIYVLMLRSNEVVSTV
jgi:predicted MFS family arabinose efflux permease